MNPMLAFTHPELARRYNLLVERMWARSWDVGITSSTRSEALQREWYALYLQGKFPNIVADPDRFYCYAPAEYGGWAARGSMHMPQADGYSHALDLYWLGCRPDQLHTEARMVGLVPVEPTENWHMQAWDVSGTFPVLEEPVTPEDIEAIAQRTQILIWERMISVKTPDGSAIESHAAIDVLGYAYEMARRTAYGVERLANVAITTEEP